MDEQEQEAIEPAGKERHGCVTAWLWLIVVMGVGTSFVYLLFGEALARSPGLRDVEPWLTPVLGVLSLANVAFGIALLRWKRWGFYGFCAMACVTLVLNLTAGIGAQSFTGLIGVLILWVILQVKGPDQVKAWDHLE